MKSTSYSFYSEGNLLDAELYQGEQINPDLPVILANSGFTGLKHIHPERFARFLTKLGYQVFAFDYRGFHKSEGEHGRVLLEDQARDISNASIYLESQLKIPFSNQVLLGWGMGAGLILQASRVLPQLHGLICLNGFYNNQRVQKALRGNQGFLEFQDWFTDQMSEQLQKEEPLYYDPFLIYPLDKVSRKYVDEVLRKAPGYGLEVTLEFAQSLLSFCVEGSLDHLANTNLLIIHGKDNALHPPEEASSLHACYPGQVQLEWLENAGHTEWMLDDHPIFKLCCERLKSWLESNS